MLPNPAPYFADLPDPRRKTRNKLHKLEDIVMTSTFTFKKTHTFLINWL